MKKTMVRPKSYRWLLFTPLLLTVGLGLMLYFSLGNAPQRVGLSQFNKPIPEFNLDSLWPDERKVTQKDFQGHIILLNVWASWCEACKSEHSFLMKLANQAEVKVYGLNYRDDRVAAMATLTEIGNPYWRNIYDPEGKLALELGVYGTPETFLISDRGILLYRYSGSMNTEVWQNKFMPQIDALLDNDKKEGK